MSLWVAFRSSASRALAPSRARHHFAGSWCASIEAATSDACERVLWYFGIGARAPSDAFEIDARSPRF